MLNRIPFKRIAALAAALPALLSGAAHAQAAAPGVASAAAAATSGKANPGNPPKAAIKIATYIKFCCASLVSYNSKGEALLQSSDGQNFVFGDAGQRIPFKHISGDVSASSVRVPHKEVAADISTDAAKVAPKKYPYDDISGRSASGFIKFTSAHNQIEVLGLTAKKQQVFKNQRGETFTINPANGDFVFIQVAQ